MANVTDPAVRLQVFGGLRMWRSGAEVDLGPPRSRVMLAALVAARGNVVSLAELIDTVWGEEPSPTAVNQVHRLIGRIRRLFEPDLPARAAGKWVQPAGDGYRLNVDPCRCDLVVFLELVQRARTATTSGEAAEKFGLALAIAQQPLFAGLDPAVLARPVFRALERERVNAAADAADLAITDPAGSPDGPAIQRIAASAPLDERLQARVIRLLRAGGRRTEAVELFERTSRRLADELGTDPGPELRAAGRGEPARPAQLPPRPAGYRPAPELSGVLDEQFAETAAGGTVVITAITGVSGAGKTALAVDWAHRVADKFPDGQLYLDLRGFDPAGLVPPVDALGELLRSIGAGPAAGAGADLDTLAARYRSALADRRMIILLDNARDSEQIRPLLPGTPGCLVIVTSRSSLISLVAREGARSVPLDRPGAVH